MTEDNLTPRERADVDAVIAHLIAKDRAFVCGICQNLVDVRLIDEHWRSHEAEVKP